MNTPLTHRICITATFAFLLLSFSGNAQPATSATSEFRLSVENVALTSDRTLEFDLYLLNTDSKNAIELALIQAGILVNPGFYEGGAITASIVAGSSQLEESQQPVSILFVKESNIIKLPSRTLKPLSKDAKPERRGSVISANVPGTRICRIKLTNTIAFSKTPAKLAFNFSKIPYPTTVSQYLKGVNTPMPCNETNCVVKP